MASPDYTQPLAALLREGTANAHESAENSVGAGYLLRGELDRAEYVRFLVMLWHVYDTFERALDRHATHPALAPTYNPAVLARAPALSADIGHLLNTADWRAHPVATALAASPPAPLAAYTARLQALADSADPAPLVAHSYVRYLGDLSGGQIIRARLGKAYGLDSDAGLQFYAFKELGGVKPATMGDMRKIKEWFRDGLNAAGGDDVERKAAIVREANLAFELNMGLFSALQAPTPKSAPVEPSTEAKELPVEIEMAHPPAFTEKSYSLASVISVVAAVCLAHFLLVTGGFTGEKGYLKWVAFEGWLQSLWQLQSQTE